MLTERQVQRSGYLGSCGRPPVLLLETCPGPFEKHPAFLSQAESHLFLSGEELVLADGSQVVLYVVAGLPEGGGLTRLRLAAAPQGVQSNII